MKSNYLEMIERRVFIYKFFLCFCIASLRKKANDCLFTQIICKDKEPTQIEFFLNNSDLFLKDIERRERNETRDREFFSTHGFGY